MLKAQLLEKRRSLQYLSHHCVTLSLLCYIIITVLHYHHYCVTLSLLCYIIITVLHYHHYCVTLSFLCYISYQVYVVTRDNESEKD